MLIQLSLLFSLIILSREYLLINDDMVIIFISACVLYYIISSSSEFITNHFNAERSNILNVIPKRYQEREQDLINARDISVYYAFSVYTNILASGEESELLLKLQASEHTFDGYIIRSAR
jgi:hypothetical protein